MPIELILAILSLLLYVVGIVLGALSFRHRTDKYPQPFWRAGFNPRNWRPIWKARDWFTHRGYIMYFTAATCVVIGSILQLIMWNL